MKIKSTSGMRLGVAGIFMAGIIGTGHAQINCPTYNNLSTHIEPGSIVGVRMMGKAGMSDAEINAVVYAVGEQQGASAYDGSNLAFRDQDESITYNPGALVDIYFVHQGETSGCPGADDGRGACAVKSTTNDFITHVEIYILVDGTGCDAAAPAAKCYNPSDSAAFTAAVKGSIVHEIQHGKGQGDTTSLSDVMGPYSGINNSKGTNSLSDCNSSNLRLRFPPYMPPPTPVCD